VKLEPNNLGISLERKDSLGYWLLGACTLVILISAFISPAFAIIFAASSIVGLPVLWITLISPKGLKFFSTRGIFGSFLFYLVIFGYIALAKMVLVPITLVAIQRAFA